MSILVDTRTGPIIQADGAGDQPLRQSRMGGLVVTDAHGRFFEPTSRGFIFSGGMGLTAINNVTFTTGTLGATCTPIVGVWNPLSSSVSVVVLQAALGITLTALAAIGSGPYVWAVSTGNSAISTGSVPFNRKTLAQSGSQAKFFAGTALTGLTNNLVVMGGSALFGGSAENLSFTATAASMQTIQMSSAENIDGSIVVPPGGVLALLATTTPVAHSAVSNLLWEEIPLTS